MTRINLIRARITQSENRESEWHLLRWLAAITAVAVLHLAESTWLAAVVDLRNSLLRDVEGRERAAVQLQPSSPRDSVDPAARPSRAASRLRSVAASMPSDLWLVGYREHQGQATMRGVSLNDEATRTFVDSLAATRVFGAIEITETTRTAAVPPNASTVLYEFQLRAVLQEVVPAVAQGMASAG